MAGVTAGALDGRRNLTGETVQFKGANENQVMFGGGEDPRGILISGNWYEVESHKRNNHYHNTVKLIGIDGNFNSYLFRKKTDYLNEQ